MIIWSRFSRKSKSSKLMNPQSKPTIETLKKCEINLKLIIKIPERLTSFRCLYCKFWKYFTSFYSVYIVDFEQVHGCWEPFTDNTPSNLKLTLKLPVQPGFAERRHSAHKMRSYLRLNVEQNFVVSSELFTGTLKWRSECIFRRASFLIIELIWS